MRLSALHGVWSRSISLPGGGGNAEQGTEYASRAVHCQIAVIVAKGITDLEIDLLSSLQSHVFGSKRLGKNNVLPVWTCLWLLILTYRSTVNAWPSCKHTHRDLAQHMYDMLVSVYSGLFASSSPLGMNWLVGDVYEMFGGDDILMQRMGTLKTEFTLFGEPSGRPRVMAGF